MWLNRHDPHKSAKEDRQVDQTLNTIHPISNLEHSHQHRFLILLYNQSQTAGIHLWDPPTHPAFFFTRHLPYSQHYTQKYVLIGTPKDRYQTDHIERSVDLFVLILLIWVVIPIEKHLDVFFSLSVITFHKVTNQKLDVQYCLLDVLC
jgi:hypothetical protein